MRGLGKGRGRRERSWRRKRKKKEPRQPDLVGSAHGRARRWSPCSQISPDCAEEATEATAMIHRRCLCGRSPTKIDL